MRASFRCPPRDLREDLDRFPRTIIRAIEGGQLHSEVDVLWIILDEQFDVTNRIAVPLLGRADSAAKIMPMTSPGRDLESSLDIFSSFLQFVLEQVELGTNQQRGDIGRADDHESLIEIRECSIDIVSSGAESRAEEISLSRHGLEFDRFRDVLKRLIELVFVGEDFGQGKVKRGILGLLFEQFPKSIARPSEFAAFEEYRRQQLPGFEIAGISPPWRLQGQQGGDRGPPGTELARCNLPRVGPCPIHKVGSLPWRKPVRVRHHPREGSTEFTDQLMGFAQVRMIIDSFLEIAQGNFAELCPPWIGASLTFHDLSSDARSTLV
jgi:hypothetical protein